MHVIAQLIKIFAFNLSEFSLQDLHGRRRVITITLHPFVRPSILLSYYYNYVTITITSITSICPSIAITIYYNSDNNL